MSKKKKPASMQKMDAFIGCVIMLNAAILAFSLDISPLWPGWEILEYVFLLIFFSEIMFKVRVLGVAEYFCGDDRCWNWFDTSIVSFGIFEMVSTIITAITQMSTSSNVGGFVRMVKIIRLTRLARVVRLLRYKIFAELKAMVIGVFSGLRVLFWAILLFFIFMFLIAIILRSSVGLNDEFSDTFGKMPWAIFTLFRCFTDGCSAHDGTPLQVRLYAKYGARFSLSYMAVFLFVTIGLFNLIMAVFVDNVMESTKQRRQMERAEDMEETERCLRTLVKNLIGRDQMALKSSILSDVPKPALHVVCWQQFSTQVTDFFRKTPAHVVIARAASQLSIDMEMLGDISSIPAATSDVMVTPDIFNQWLYVPEFRAMLEVLEISSSNPRELFDVLDADMSGELTVEELVVGLMSLRGPAEKSYTVASLLCVRVVQTMLRNLIQDSEERHALLLRAIQQSQGNARPPAAGGTRAPRPSAASLGLADVD